MYDLPILFVAFNRLDTTRRVFEQIRKVQPLQLYLYCDAPRAHLPAEAAQCHAVRQYLLTNIDWPCDIKTFFPTENLGPGKGLATAIKWFFGEVEAGMVLEHDCYPELDFFDYCRTLIAKYKNHESVRFIGGTSFTARFLDSDISYGFNKLSHIWGWATWKYVVEEYAYDLFPTDREIRQVMKSNHCFLSPAIERHYRFVAHLHRTKKIDTWDFQLLYTIWKQGGICITPHVNLVSNIGFGENAVHCIDPNHPFANLPTFPILPLKHPAQIEVNHHYDSDFYFTYLYKSKWRYFLSYINYALKKSR